MFDRRAFIKLAGLGSIAVAGTAVASPLTTVKFGSDLYKTSKTRLLMGTFVNITVMHTSRDQAEEAVEKAFELASSKEAMLTRYSDSSPVGALNREGGLKDLEPELICMLTTASEYNRLTGGAFDITIKPVIDLVKESFARRNAPPASDQMDKALSLVGMDGLEMSGKSITFTREGMGITLDGIAKGFIADETAEFLRSKGIKHSLVNAGGDIRAIGGREEGKPWRIAVRDPERDDRYACVIKMVDGAVATSGNYEVFFDQEKTFHHIVDPESGKSPRADQSVSIFCDATVRADALSTAVFVMNPRNGVKFLNRLPNVEGFLITAEGDKLHTDGWNKLNV